MTGSMVHLLEMNTPKMKTYSPLCVRHLNKYCEIAIPTFVFPPVGDFRSTQMDMRASGLMNLVKPTQ